MKKLLLKAKSLILIVAVFCLFSPYAKGAIATFHTTYGFGAQMADDPTLIAKYNQWVSWFVTANGAGGYLRVHYPEGVSGNGDATASEGIGYGMILAVYFNDQTTFNGLWNYKVNHSPSKGLMGWLVNSGGSVLDQNSATDGDSDIAMALVLAQRRWGSAGAFNYNSLATTEINKIASSDIDGTDYHVFPGGYASHGTNDPTYPSYFTPAWYTEFGVQTGNTTFWGNVVSKAATMLASSRNSGTGLDGETCSSTGTGTGSDGYNSARIPWRYALDYVWNGTATSLSQINLDNAFFAGKATSVGAVYNVGGGGPTDPTHNGMRVGPVGCSFMVAGKTTDLTAFYTEASSLFNDSGHFYNSTLALLALIEMSGNCPKVFGAQPPTPTPPTGDLFDSCEDKDNVNEWGGYWYTYDDLATPNNGDSLVVPWTDARYAKALRTPTPFYMQAPGYPSSGYGTLYCARMTGVVTTTYTYGFIGMGSGTNSDSGLAIPQVADLTMYTGMRFWVKTNNATDSYSIKINCPAAVTNPAGNDYKYSFLGSTTWSQVLVPFTALTQENWGASTVYVDKTLVLKNSTNVQWQTVGQPKPAIDISVDDIEFYPAKTPTQVPTYCPGQMLDSLEDGNSQNEFGGYWYTYNNLTAPASTVWPSSATGATFTPSAPGANGTFYCARMTGTVSSAAVPFVGMGTNMAADGIATRNVSMFVGLNFWIKGDGYMYSVKIKPGATVNTGGNEFKFSFITNPGTWEQMTVPFSIFTQEKNWGTVATLASVLTNLQQIQFESKGTLSHAVDLSIDDLQFECSQGWTATATKTPVVLVSPTNTPTMTATRTPTPTRTGTSTYTPTNTATYTSTIGNSATFTSTRTITMTNTVSIYSPTITPTVTVTSTVPTATFTFTTVPASPTFTSTNVVVIPSPTFTSTDVPFTATNTPTDTLTNTPTASPTPSATTGTPGTCMFDDMEDINSQNNYGGYWYSYTGISGDPGNIVWPAKGETLTPSAGGANGTQYAMRITGVVAPVNGATSYYPSIGMGSQLSSTSGGPSYTEVDISSCTGIRFWVKGDGKTYLMKVPYTNATDGSLTGYDDFKITFTAPAAWSQLNASFSSFTQGWTPPGLLISTVLQHAKQFQWQNTDNTGAGPVTEDLWVDEVQLVGCASCPAMSPTAVVNTPTFTPTTVVNTPTFTLTFTQTFTYSNTNTPTYTNTNTPTPTDTPTTVPTVNAPSLDAIIYAPGNATVGQQINVTMTVNNNGNSLINGIMPPAALTITGTGVLTLSSGPLPANVASLDINATTTFVWVYTVTTAGPILIQGTASGNGGTVISPLKPGVAMTLALAPTLTPTDTLTFTPTPVNTDTPIGTATFTVTYTPTIMPTGAVIAVVTATPVLIYPNPNPTPGTTPGRIIAYTVNRPITKAVFKLYTSMGRLIRMVEDTTEHIQGKVYIGVEGSYFTGLARGIYYYVIIVTDKATGTVAKSPIEKVIIQ